MRFPRPLSRGAVAAACAAGAIGVAGVVVAAVHLSSSNSPVTTTSAGTAVDGPTQVQLVGMRNGRVPWNKPVTLQITNGHLRSVAVTGNGSGVIDGTLGDGDSTWRSAETLVPTTRYRANVTFVDSADHEQSTVLTFAAADAAKHLKVTLSPGDGQTVGVGSPVIASFSRPVPKDERAMVEARFAVSVTPSVVGAWHWMSGESVHWRPPSYWHSGTKVHVASDLQGVDIGHQTYGPVGMHKVSFKDRKSVV